MSHDDCPFGRVIPMKSRKALTKFSSQFVADFAEVAAQEGVLDRPGLITIPKAEPSPERADHT